MATIDFTITPPLLGSKIVVKSKSSADVKIIPPDIPKNIKFDYREFELYNVVTNDGNSYVVVFKSLDSVGLKVFAYMSNEKLEIVSMNDNYFASTDEIVKMTVANYEERSRFYENI